MQDSNDDQDSNWNDEDDWERKPVRASRRANESFPVIAIVVAVVDLVTIVPRGFSIVGNLFALQMFGKESTLFAIVSGAEIAIDCILIAMIFGVLIGMICQSRWGLLISRALIPVTILSMLLAIAFSVMPMLVVNGHSVDPEAAQLGMLVQGGIAAGIAFFRAVYLVGYYMAMNEYAKFLNRGRAA